MDMENKNQMVRNYVDKVLETLKQRGMNISEKRKEEILSEYLDSDKDFDTIKKEIDELANNMIEQYLQLLGKLKDLEEKAEKTNQQNNYSNQMNDTSKVTNNLEKTTDKMSEISEIKNKNNTVSETKEIIKNNSYLSSNEIFEKVIVWLDEMIPENYKNNFYNNLKTLKVDLEFNEVDNQKQGKYDSRNNEIFINEKSIKSLSDNENIQKLLVAGSFLHELCHMASSHYDEKNNVITNGFCVSSDDKSERNIGLTEGFTEILTANFMFGIGDHSAYLVEMSIAYQLGIILGFDKLKEVYFGNLGVKELENSLNYYNNDEEKNHKLFESIEDNFLLKNFDKKQPIFKDIEKYLIDLLKIKLTKDNFSMEEKHKYLEKFEDIIVKKEELEKRGLIPENLYYDEITEHFNNTKQEILNKNDSYKEDYSNSKLNNNVKTLKRVNTNQNGSNNGMANILLLFLIVSFICGAGVGIGIALFYIK